MKLNQALHGLDRGHSYRHDAWPEGTYIKKGENDLIHQYSNDNLSDQAWVPTFDQVNDTAWHAVDVISAPGPTPEDKIGGLLRKLADLPVGTVLTHYTQVDTTDLAFFDTTTERLTFQYRDEDGSLIPSDPTLTLLQLPDWVNEHEPAAELNPPTTLEEPDMTISNREEILKLCAPLQERLRESKDFVRIEIPIADAGIQVEGQDASLLISIQRDKIVLHVHVDGRLLDFNDFTINQRLVAGPISQREAKPLAAIAVPNFMVSGIGRHHAETIDDNVSNMLSNTDNDVNFVAEQPPQQLRSTFDPELVVEGIPERTMQPGTYIPLSLGDRYFDVTESKNGLVFGTFLPAEEGESLAVVSINVFELLFTRLPKVSKGVRLQLAGVGTQVIIDEVGADTAIVDIDLGFSRAVAEVPLNELQDDKWVFVSFATPVEAPAEPVAQKSEQPAPETA